MPDKIDITVEDDGKGVSAEALRTLLNQTLAFLENQPGGGDGVSWRVTRASMNSPFSMTVERVMPEGVPEPPDRPAERLARYFAEMEQGQMPGDGILPVQVRRLASIAQVAQPGRRVEIRADRGRSIRIDSQWAAPLKQWIQHKAAQAAMPEQQYSLAGRLEGVDVHGRKSEFYVYDPLTDQKMRCLFDEGMMTLVKSSLSERVEVAGLARFNANDEPVRMRVSSLRVITSQPFMARLKDAQRRGIMNLTGDLTIDEALSEIRDGTH